MTLGKIGATPMMVRNAPGISAIVDAAEAGAGEAAGGGTPRDSELMPSKITAHSNTVANTTDALRAKFLTGWGGTRS